MKKFFKWLALVGAGIFVLVGLIAGVSQTQFFRDHLRSFALSRLDTLLDADVSLGEIRGNLVTGFSIDSVSIFVRGEPLLQVERVVLRYDLFQIPSKRITVSHLALVRPRVALVRGIDGIWNFERMTRPKPEESPSTFDWPIKLDRFEIKEGSLRLIDSAALAASDHVTERGFEVEYHDFHLHSLDLLVTSVLIAPKEKRAHIAQIGFVSDRPPVHLQHCSGDVRLTDHDASVNNLTIRTARSHLNLSASMKGIDLLEGIELTELQRKLVGLSLRASDLDLNELQRFIPQLAFFDGKVNAEIVAEGEFGRLGIQQIDLRTRNSEVHLAGTLFNLHTPEALAMDIKCRESTIAYADVQALMPGLSLPDFSSIGNAKLSFDFEGEPLRFVTNVSLESDAGSITTSGFKLAIGGEPGLAYEGNVVLQNVNLDALLGAHQFASSLNGTLHVVGTGTAIDKLDARAGVFLDSSSIGAQRIGPTSIIVTANRGNLEGVVRLALGSMRTDLEATLHDVANPMPCFTIVGTISSLDLAELLDNPYHTSDLTLRLNAEGTGLEWEKVNCSALLDFSSSRYREYRIDSGAVRLEINQRDPTRSSIVLTSDLADFSITGQFDLDYMVGLIRYEVNSLRFALGQRLNVLDPSLATELDEQSLRASGARLAAQHKMLNATYELRVKNLEPLSIVTANRAFDAVGMLSGSLRGSYAALAGDARLEVKEFFYGSADSGMLVQDGLATLRFDDLMPDAPLSSLTLRIRVDAGRMHINRTKLDTLQFGIFYDKEYAGFVVQADYDQDYHFRTNGHVGVTDDGVQFTLSRFSIAYKDFRWLADDGWVIAVNQNAMHIPSFVLRRDSQVVALSGTLFAGEGIEASMQGTKLDLQSLKYIIRKEERRVDERGFEGRLDVAMRAGGTLTSPTYDLSLKASDVYFRGFFFGAIRGTFAYSKERLTADVTIDHRADTAHGVPDLTVRGTLPIRLALKGVEERLPEEPMDFEIKTEGLQMSLLDPLVPTFNELTGTLKADVRVGGSPQRPQFAGTMSVDNCRFLFEPNNMYYKLDGQFQPNGERITILDVVIRNVDEDNSPGRIGKIHLKGDSALRDLIPTDFHVDITGQLVVVNKNTRTSTLGVYGELPVEVAGNGLRFTGSIEHSLLKGDVLVRNASLVFPPTAASAREDTFFIPFHLMDDTARGREDLRAVEARYFGSTQRTAEQASEANVLRAPSFMDGLRYDLNVEFAGTNNEVRMIFNAATNEELVANIAGRVAITEDGRYWVGTLEVLRASYTFYGKRFNAEGSMTYAGDLLNPELNITATYAGTRTNDQVQPPATEQVVVTYKITGTRMAPKAEISMKIDDVDYATYSAGPKSGDVQSDALTFIITNTFPLKPGERNNIAEQIGPTVGAGLVGGATSLLTSTLAEFLRTKTGFIQSFELRYDTSVRGGSFRQSADVRLGGTAFKGYWRYGGKILEDPINNANFSILYSFGDIFDKPSLRNFMFELERRVDTSTLFGSIETRKEINSARFFYRFSF